MAQRLPQPLHIFAKDLRHLWPETLVSLLLFVAFAWSAPSGWAQSPYAGVAQLLAGFLKLLMPIAWLVVISRLIHDEPLVGDRQFWTSRPYHWAKLLAAKILYLIAFLYLPFLVMQVYLLKHAGLYPTTAIPALLHNLLLLTVVIIIPVAAIAAVTATFARLLLSVLGAIIYLLILTGLAGWLTWRRMAPPALQPIFIAILILVPAVALVLQYATRRTSIARILLVVTPLLVVLVLFLTPAAALIRHAYPIASGAGIPALSDLPDQFRPKSVPAGRLRTIRNEVQLTIPFTVTGIDRDSNFLIQGVAATVDAPGVHWTSPYLNGFGQQINASSPIAMVSVQMPLDVFNKVRSSPASVHLSLATEHLKAESPSTWPATLLPFAVPGHGLCSYSSDDPDQPPTCRYPFKTPELNFVSARLAAGSCSAPAAAPIQGRTALGSSASSLDFDPVITVPITFPSDDPNPDHHYLLCPGTPLNFIEAKSEGRTRIEVDEKQVLLDLYALRITPQNTPQPQPGPQ